MKRTSRNKLSLQKEMVRVLVRPVDDDSLRQVVGGNEGGNGGSLVNCPTRISGECSCACGG